MDINEITIFSNVIPSFYKVISLISKILDLEEDSLISKIVTIDDWYFTNEQQIYNFEEGILNDKIVLVDLNLKISNERIAHVQFEKEEINRMDIYFDKNIIDMISEKLFDALVELVEYNFKFIAFGDDYLLNYSDNINYLINHTSSIKYWLIPKKDKKYDILTIEDF